MTTPIPAFSLYGESLHDRFPDGLHIETIPARSQGHNWRIRTHRHHDLHQFFWIEAGGGCAQIEGMNYDLSSQCAIIIPPFTIHSFTFEPETTGFVASLPTATLDRVFVDDVALRTSLEHPAVLATQPLDHDWGGCVDMVMKRADDEFRGHEVGRRTALLAHATLISLCFVRLMSEEANASTQATKDNRAILVRRYLKQIEARFQTQRPLSAYAQELGVSTSHLSRVCRDVLGYSALTLLHNRILLEAKRKLAYTSLTVSEVAFALGFSDPAYFSRFFAAKMGKSPSVWRASVSDNTS